jgi:ABC-2 type transport system permease protein
VNQLFRYFRLWLALARFSLVRELAFRTNFLVKIFVEILWLGILIAFYETIFAKTNLVADWDRYQYLFFLGFYFALGGLLETLFLENCNNFADLVRTGDLDFYLLKPMDEQFLVSCRTVDWSCAPNVLMGAGVMLAAFISGGQDFDAGRLVLFFIMLGCGTALAYGFLLLLTSASIWFMRNQSLFEMWWLFSTLMRYPREIFRGNNWVAAAGFFFSFVIPIMLVTNVPAAIMMRAVRPEVVAYTVAATLAALWVSRRFFKFALERYRSASS